MRFPIDRLLQSQRSVESLIERKGFMTYANLYSFRVGGDLSISAHYVADGWPVRLWACIKLKRRVALLSFFRIRDFWISVAKSKRCVLIGHSRVELAALKKWFDGNGFNNFMVLSDGFCELSELEALIKALDLNSVDIVFLALSQPKQEQLMAKLYHLEGDVSIVACGAFWLQEARLSPAPTMLVSNFGLYGVFRFWGSPKIFFERTFKSIGAMFRNFQ